MTLLVACPSPVLQFFDNFGNPLSGGSVLTQVGGVNEPTYQDSAGVTPLPNPIPLNSRGEISNAAGVTQQLFLIPNTVYTFTLSDKAGNQIYEAQYVDGIQINQQTLGQLLYPLTAAETAAGVTPTNYIYPPGNVLRYGADPTASADSTNAFSSAIGQASQLGATSADVSVPGGSFLIGGSGMGLTVSASGVKIVGQGMGLTKLLAAANAIWVLKIAASNCIVRDLLIDGNSHTTVDGLVCAPANESVTNATSQVNFNDFFSLQIQNCNNGLRERAGPSVSGVDSGCFYNNFYGCFWLNCTRGIWFENAVNAGNGAPNRGSFHGCRVGSAGTVSNTGLQIDSGTTTQFFGTHFEGIANGTSPSTTPTAVVIAATASSGLDNTDNVFVGCINEANTQDLYNLAVWTEIIGGLWSAAKFQSGNVLPINMVGGTDTSVMPTVIEGMVHGEGISGYPSGFWGMTKEIADYSTSGPTYYNWQSYSLTTAIVSNTASLAGATSHYRQLSNMVDWALTFSFNASSAGTIITITPPIAPNTAQYCTLQASNPFYAAYVNNGSSIVAVSAGWTSAGKLYFSVPSGNWNTSGNNNAIFLQVQYHI